MKNLIFLLVICFSIVVLNVCWILFHHFASRSKPITCVCNCSDKIAITPTFSGVTSTAVYSGYKNSAPSCSCQSFLVPRLKSYFPTNTSEICEVCQCNDDSIYACTDGAQMFSQKFITVTSTITFITLLALAIKSLCSDRNRLKHRERFGCRKEGMDTDASKPLIDAELGALRDKFRLNY
ncbi:hypothetical protein CDAR_467991 [Caerostris darwini]|uniref:Uncharacterized protein n=1 Tax=Caerostris darwini TaxID=1538125 RepID=A0AAV4WYB8_9ARAC|nr:hypothetical protein CDAR_467991 [Caerostris darwini]